MTQEEKAKRYDEALERARNIHKDAVEMENSIITKTCEVIFPEFKEPEDERIRKNCIHFLELQKSHHASTVEIDECVAWLERQGETSRQQRVEEAMQEVDEKAKIFTEAMEGKTSEEILAEMRGEQKPNKCEGCNNVKGYVACVDGSEWAHIEKCYPAWSEEDKDFMYDTLSNLTELKDRYGEEYGNVGKCIDWLKSLKDRVGCEVNCTTTKEWSENDEERLSDAIFFVREYQIPTRDKRLLNAAKETEDWLKSLRPQNTWKPSDKQMELLKEACDQHWEPDGLDPLYTLYQDLKKLRGE